MPEKRKLELTEKGKAMFKHRRSHEEMERCKQKYIQKPSNRRKTESYPTAPGQPRSPKATYGPT